MEFIEIVNLEGDAFRNSIKNANHFNVNIGKGMIFILESIG